MGVIFSCSITFKPVYQHTQVLFLRAGFNPFYNQPAFVIGIASNQMQDLALGPCWSSRCSHRPSSEACQGTSEWHLLLSSISTRSHSWVLSGNQLSVHSNPLSMLLKKVLHSAGPSNVASSLVSAWISCNWPQQFEYDHPASSLSTKSILQTHFFPVWRQRCNAGQCQMLCARKMTSLF